METMTHGRRVEIAAEERSPFRPHGGLAAPDLFLDTMLTGEHERHARSTVWKYWLTYMGTDLDMSPEWQTLPTCSTGRACSFRHG
jgi:hypothetical protein